MRDVTDDWEGVRFSVEESRDKGDFIVARVRFRGRGRASRADIDVPIGVVSIVRAGKIVETHMYSDPAEAFAVAWLQP